MTAQVDLTQRQNIPQDLFAVFWRRRWIALGTFVAVLVGVAIITASLPRTYETTAYVLVNPSRPSSTDFEATQVSGALLTTYAELLRSQNLANDVERRLGPRANGNPVDSISVEPVPESQLLKITGSGPSPRAAQTLTNVYTQVFQDRTRELAAADASAGRASVAEPATLPIAPASPKPALYLAVGVLLGALAALGAVLLAQRLDQRIEVGDGITDLLGLPIIGRIPQGSAASVGELLAGGQVEHGEARAVAESFRLLLANLAFANMGKRPATIAIVSSEEQEGKSTSALSLVRAAGELGIRALLVEADLRRPSLAQKTGAWAADNLGFSSLLVRHAPLSEAVWQVPNSPVDLLPAGPLPPNPAALLGSDALREFDAEARETYDLVIYDTPPLSVAADASLLAAIVESVVLVVDARRTTRKVAAEAVAQLRRAHAEVIGVVVNRLDTPTTYSMSYYAPDPARIMDAGGAPPAHRRRSRAPK
jgi:succinoglycan biosynthesis transport protein ExoP